MNKLNTRPYDLYKLVNNYFIGLLYPGDKSNFKPAFPEYLGDFRYLKDFKKTGPKKSYQLALYKNRAGVIAIAKMRSAKIHDYHYLSLKNEIIIYEVLLKTLSKFESSHGINKFAIPKLFEKYEDQDKLVALFEFVEGTTLENDTIPNKLSAHFEVSNYLTNLGQNISKNDRHLISERSPFQLFCFFPLILLKCLINYPDKVLILFKAAIKFYSKFYYLLTGYKKGLTHRDLHFQNIIQNKDKFYLIDLQQVVFSDKLHEHVVLLRYCWHEDEFDNFLLKEIIQRNQNRKYFKEIFQVLMINSTVHGLTDNTFGETVKNNWFDFLTFATNFNLKTYV